MSTCFHFIYDDDNVDTDDDQSKNKVTLILKLVASFDIYLYR